MENSSRIDMKTGSFIAAGKEYALSEFITLGREQQYMAATARLAFDLDWKGTFRLINSIYLHATTGDSALSALHKIATESLNALDGIKAMAEGDRIPAVYELCALVLNVPGEDTRTISEEQIKQKYADWNTTEIPREDFFELAVASMTYTSDALKVLREAREKAEAELAEATAAAITEINTQ